MLINNIITVSASVFIGYYKSVEMYRDYREKKHGQHLLELNDVENDVENDVDNDVDIHHPL